MSRLTGRVRGRAGRDTRGAVLLYPERGSGRVYSPDGEVVETLAGEPPPATSKGWGDLSWLRQCRRVDSR